MNCILENVITNICRYDYKYFLCKTNVIGLGMAYKIVNSFKTCEKCLQIYVIKKISVDNLNPCDIIPKLYKGIKTDVVETGIFTATGFTDKVRPVIGGYSIGAADFNQTGTITCLVQDKNSRYILGTNHCLANENRLPLNSPIIQPSLEDQGMPTTDVVANLSRFTTLQFLTPRHEPPNYADSAIALITNIDIASPSIAVIGIPSGVDYPALGIKVQKSGRTTGYNTGEITATHVTYYMAFASGRFALMIDQAFTNIETLPGDSGALVLDFNKKALGQIISNGGSTTAITPITNILSLLNVSLVTS